ncbi:hypothetical protein PMAYCL1PPCAC_15611, partial [Pristionchus mayeri]
LVELRWSPFCFFLILVQSFQYAVAAQMFVMAAYLMPSGDSIANGTYTSVRDEWPNVPRIFVWTDSYDMISSAEFAGNLLFGVIPNLLSDRYGRRAVLVVVLYGIGIADIACALAPNFWTLIMARFLQGSFITAITSLNFVYVIESIDRNCRFFAYCAFGFFWMFGYCIVAPTALLIGSWRSILIVNGFFVLLCALLESFLVPESPYFCVALDDLDKLEEFVKTSQWFNRRSYNV